MRITHVNDGADSRGIGKVHTGTTTVGIVLKDGIVLGADTRATMGAYVASKQADKIHQINEKVAGTIAGGFADAQHLMDSLTERAKLYKLRTGRTMPANAVTKVLSNMLFQAKYPFPYQVHHLIAGEAHGEFKLYDVGGYGSILDETFASTGSGSVFAYGVLEDGFSEELSIEQGVDLVKKSIRAAISRDIASGNGVNVFIITKDGIEKRSFPPTE